MKKIPLTQGKFALVDNEDFEWLNQYKWCATKDGNMFYVVRSILIRSQNKSKKIKRKYKKILMHREIIEKRKSKKLRKDEAIDHINRNGLDNREYNLRLIDRSKNGANSIKQKTYRGKSTSSIYKGVRWDKRSKKWRTQITINYKKIYLGSFKYEIEAAKIYDEAARKYFGEFANTNFDL